MIHRFIFQQILNAFPYEPTAEQREAIDTLAHFLSSPAPNDVLLLKGYAGTGKTSLLGATVKALTALEQSVVLLAPTGRAAKVFSEYAGRNALTIHRKIYRQKTFSNEFTGFSLAPNLHRNTLFIIDEASMISNDDAGMASFSSGRLLDDLMRYVYGGEGCKLILLGDGAQLPPVSQSESPAMNPDYLKGYSLHVRECSLTQVVRQDKDSGVLFNATLIRDSLHRRQIDRYPILRLAGFEDIRKVSGEELIEEIASAYSRDGADETIVICRSNKRATLYNNGIRNRILYREEEISTGDRLMVVRNNYFWTSSYKEMDFIANGEMVEVLRIRRTIEMYGFRFCDVSLRFQDYDLEIDLRILLDTLQSDTSALPKEQSDRLFFSVLEDYADEPTKAAKMKKLKVDPYYNAVQVKYAYAVTCHKAQGGQWRNVFLDIGYMTQEMLGEDFYRWLYTAFTRATHRLYLVNLPKEFEEGGG
ncbi:ATP-dependent RecD-like DNA helicase [Tannerella sp.]|uniref:ATP-dependent DNA helicase n=1 Tax=Tannerella sp. TaxID=2382127 RepID=UPI0026DD852E|nr:AAA family ATPase [Tannerella sp.]MDO4703309.1 AAA family ATPase [Tannerella sp.]